MRRHFKTVCFDLDGTLLPNNSVSLWLAQRMGHGPEMQRLEDRFLSGEISNLVIADATALWFRGRHTGEIWDLLAMARWIDGVQPTIAALRARGLSVILGTITWRIAGEFLRARHGFDDVSGTEMEIRDDVLTGRVTRYFDEFDKRRFVENFCRAQGVSLEECVAIGDSRSDIPLFREVGLAIAFNGTPAARAAAHVSVDGPDLTAVLDPIFGDGVSGLR
jgi:phosphoserine phosphatase